mmetsp:Transcript_44276/g.58754  ORF Transcript_44276/g.58754 Transcript_44276/m.58754 type:complete len:261 (-) Transcript_44276:1782-2564(-)
MTGLSTITRCMARSQGAVPTLRPLSTGTTMGRRAREAVQHSTLRALAVEAVLVSPPSIRSACVLRRSTPAKGLNKWPTVEISAARRHSLDETSTKSLRRSQSTIKPTMVAVKAPLSSVEVNLTSHPPTAVDPRVDPVSKIDTSMMKKATMVSKTTSKKRTTTARKWMQHPCKSTASKTMRAQGDLNQPTSTSNSSARSSKTCSRRTPSHQARLPSRTPTPRAATRTHMRRRVMLTRVKRTTLWTSSSKSIIAASAAKSTK